MTEPESVFIRGHAGSWHGRKAARRLRLFPGLFCLLLFILTTGYAGAAEWSLFPSGRLFRPLLADPSEPRFGLYSLLGESRLEGMIGGSWEGFEAKWDATNPTRVRVGLDTGVFTLLRKTGASFPLDTADFLIGLHVDAQRGAFTGRLSFTHVSAHLADGYQGPRQRITWSREFFTLYGAYTRSVFRIYGSVRLSNHAIPDIRRRGLQIGGEVISGPLAGRLPRLYLAGDWRFFNDGGWTVSQTGQAGVILSNPDRRGLRLSLILHSGRSEHGQFHDLNDRFAGAGIFFDL